MRGRRKHNIYAIITMYVRRDARRPNAMRLVFVDADSKDKQPLHLVMINCVLDYIVYTNQTSAASLIAYVKCVMYVLIIVYYLTVESVFGKKSAVFFIYTFGND